MTKEEQLDILLDILTKQDFHKYQEINEEMLKNGIDISKIPKEKLSFSAYRFQTDMDAKAPDYNRVYFNNPDCHAEKKYNEISVLAYDIMTDIFCNISRTYEGRFIYNKSNCTIEIILPDKNVYTIIIDKLYRTDD